MCSSSTSNSATTTKAFDAATTIFGPVSAATSASIVIVRSVLAGCELS